MVFQIFTAVIISLFYIKALSFSCAQNCIMGDDHSWLTPGAVVFYEAGIAKQSWENLLGFKLYLYDEQCRISTDVYRGAWTCAQIGS